ncbi:MAG: cobyrinate a,c-diamide synthase [Chloroflexota bacterium]|nr:cobyrinate a,c-diamide synthase [Chloroflexota bacterium]
MSGRIVLAGSASNIGKTTLAVGLIAALRRRGLAIQPFKIGPDYIDPTYHTLAAGLPSRNLDSWLVPHDRLRDCFAHATRNADLAIIEGMMGLYDGLDYRGEAGSTAEVAKLLAAPVVVILDVSAQARSAAATALGFQQLDPALSIAGFICNRIGGPGHYCGVKAAIEEATGLPVFGGVPQSDAVVIPERHLGLIPTGERHDLRPLVEQLAHMIAETCDLNALLALARIAPPLVASGKDPALSANVAPTGDAERPVIAIARDKAFSFYYEDNLDLLRIAGAEIVPFSPLSDAHLPNGTAGIYIGGGFPEIYAAALAANDTLRQEIHDAVTAGIPCYAECGGLMYLTGALVDAMGDRHLMVGLLPGHAMMTEGWPKLGYTTVRARRDTPILRAGEAVRGYEFHSSTWEAVPTDASHAYTVYDARGEHPEGFVRGNLLASYVHLHFWSMPALAVRFVTMCRELAKNRARP